MPRAPAFALNRSQTVVTERCEYHSPRIPYEHNWRMHRQARPRANCYREAVAEGGKPGPLPDSRALHLVRQRLYPPARTPPSNYRPLQCASCPVHWAFPPRDAILARRRLSGRSAKATRATLLTAAASPGETRHQARRHLRRRPGPDSRTEETRTRRGSPSVVRARSRATKALARASRCPGRARARALPALGRQSCANPGGTCFLGRSAAGRARLAVRTSSKSPAAARARRGNTRSGRSPPVTGMRRS